MPRQQLGLNLPVGLPGLVGPSSCLGWISCAGGGNGLAGGLLPRQGSYAAGALRDQVSSPIMTKLVH
ncbi:hypothetical protein Pyn_36916 [Prunus yedoensis var. nudiflora]|uniref:Uncharacterized protein n=1 Tax=Prunus yedoensis var. nudiflora TaxID=2094558 RepID=A0A314YHF4_PRUYE|nr:hypothetical protein Pyn_36916 [Prunus yedoensis var. nudiflora]